MTYRIEGLDPRQFQHLFGLDDALLKEQRARRVIANQSPGFPCRVTLQDAEPGEALILVNYTSQDADTPYRTSYAVFVREGVTNAATYRDELPPVLMNRPLSFRGFDAEGMLIAATLAQAGEAEDQVLKLLDDPQIETIHAHNAAYGCFAAKIERN